MSDMALAIMDSAERRMRKGGFGGFSFREIAADVGVKSSTVHYHFPTKENLAAAVVRRYVARVSGDMDRRFEAEPDAVKVWTQTFRGTLHSEDRMCPCTVLGASALDLPQEVAAAVAEFFQMCLEKLTAQGLSAERAAEFLSTIVGAQVVANALNDPGAYDRAIEALAARPG